MYKTRAVTKKKEKTTVPSVTAAVSSSSANVTVTDTNKNKNKTKAKRNVKTYYEPKPDDNNLEEEKEESVYEHNNILSTEVNAQRVLTERRYPIFLQEPFHLDLELSDTSIELLNGRNWLSTDLIDYLIKQGLPSWKPEILLVPTTNIVATLDIYNYKAISKRPQNLSFLSQYREKYKHYTTKAFRIITICCEEGHFFVLDFIFDATDPDGDYFQYITCYDSLLRSKRNTPKGKKKIVTNKAANDILLKYKEFFCHYVLYNTENVNNIMSSNDILDAMSYGCCPIQDNGYDCALYAFAILLHLCHGIKMKDNLFTQSEITYFRKSLYIVLKAPEEELKCNPKKFISEEFILTFFNHTYTFKKNDKPNYFLDYLHRCTNYVSPKKDYVSPNEPVSPTRPFPDNTENLDSQPENVVVLENDVNEETLVSSDEHIIVQEIVPFEDTYFKEIFVFNSVSI